MACKSSGLKWDAHKQLWKLQFHNVKLRGEGADAAFDELLLATYTPRGIYVHRHNGRLGVSRTGKEMAVRGSEIRIYGPRNEADWAKALDETLLPKLEAGGCKGLAVVRW